MSFKIVQTKESGSVIPSLTIVPAAWEKEGRLYWPPAKKKILASKLIKVGTSKPEADWVPHPCIKKRHHFLNYEAAELEINSMIEKTDSEVDGAEETIKSATKRKEIGRVPQANFNVFAQSCKKVADESSVWNQEEAVCSSISTTLNPTCAANTYGNCILPIGYSIIKTINDEDQQDEQPLIIDQYEFDEENNQIETEEETFTNINPINLKLIVDSQNKILENQNRIFEQFAKQQTMLDFLGESLMNGDRNRVSDGGGAQTNDPTPDPFPIDSIGNLDELEAALQGEQYMEKLVQSKSQICGTSGKLNGLNASYRLIDQLITRKCLTRFSWAGGSRKQEAKLPFKVYKNILKFFYNIIRKADIQFSEKDNEDFFRNILKNSRRRHELSLIPVNKRASASKARPKNLQYKRKLDEAPIIIEPNVNNTETENEDLNAGALENEADVDNM